jgi:hypothetical protein
VLAARKDAAAATSTKIPKSEIVGIYMVADTTDVNCIKENNLKTNAAYATSVDNATTEIKPRCILEYVI